MIAEPSQSDTNRFTYLSVPEIVNRVGLYVTGVGNELVPPGAEYPNRKHPELYDFSWHTGRILPEFQLVFVESGGGEFESPQTGLLQVEAGTAILLFPDVWHRYRPHQETGWNEYWVSLGGELLFKWHKRDLFSIDQPLIKLKHPKAAKQHYRDLIEAAMKPRESTALQLTAGAMSIVTNALEGSDPLAPAADTQQLAKKVKDDSIHQSLQIIWNYSHQRISVDMIARQIGVNRRTLERHFKQQLGKTILQELVGCRIQRAKRLLRQTHVPIKYVAYAAGFSSLSNLCKVFRREVGMTPGEYRESKIRP